MCKVFLLLGSNLGHRQGYLQQAADFIGRRVGQVEKTSSVYETQAWGKTIEPDYLNQVLIVKTALSPQQLIAELLQIEQELGRERVEKWGSRTIDIDILFYDDMVINQPGLTIPHPELQNRRFTLEPLTEIAPGLEHPVLKKNMVHLKNELDDCLIVKKL